MRTLLLTLLGLLSYFMTYAQVCGFETPQVFNSEYTDTGDASVAHNLVDNPNEPFVNWPTVGDELGFSARYEPYDDPDVGLTDGDAVGVTDVTNVVASYPQGSQGFVVSDADGNFILEFDPVVSTSTNPVFSIHYFIAETGYEGDGSTNASGSDRLRIFVRHLEEGDEYDVLDTTGNDINDLGIEGQWILGSVNLPPYSGTPATFQVVIEARNNSSSEAFFFDNLMFNLSLETPDFAEMNFRLFPNPAQESIQIQGVIDATPITVQFFDLLGKEIQKLETTEHQIQLHHLRSGLYLVKVTQGNRQRVLKLLKQ